MADKNMKSLDDIVFEHKNKSYGAYRLRSTEKGYLMKAFFIGTTIFVIFVLLLYYYNRWQAKKGAMEKSVNVELQNIETPKEEEIIEIKPKEEEPPPPPVKQEEVAQIKAVMPEPKRTVVREEPPPTMEETRNRALGTENREGRPTNDPTASSGPPVEAPPAPPQPRMDDNAIFEKVEVEAEYPGGVNSLRQFVASRIEYPERAIDKGTSGRVTLNFVVERDGSVSNVTILKDIGDGCGQEAVRVLKMTKKWKPATVNGKPVRSYYRFPVNFTLSSS